MAAAVMTFVCVPQAMWTLTQSCPLRVTPYFSSNQRTNFDVEKPDESTAKVVSIALSGRLLRAMSAFKYGVRSSSSRNVFTRLQWRVRDRKPRSVASCKSQLNRREDSVE